MLVRFNRKTLIVVYIIILNLFLSQKPLKMDTSVTQKQVKKIPKTQGYAKKLNESATDANNNLDSNKQLTQEESVINAFEFFDSIKKGNITCREYFSILLGTKQFTEEEIEKIIHSSNLDMNGIVDYRKFYQFWNNK